MSLLVQTIGLAVVDAVNPCALAVMVIVLMTLLLEDPNNKKKALYGGLMFTLAVFILYFIYGLVMIQFFSHAIPNTGVYSSYIFRGFGIFAVVLGLLNLKDYISYKPGGFITEMPLKMRPKMKLLIKRMTSPKGAFVIGIIVTLFLLPCTIGPYIVFSGNVSTMAFFKTLPWLILYNLIFILPMLIVTFVIYFGVTTVDNVSGWKERNIRKLHLIEGIILIILGVLMFTGVI